MRFRNKQVAALALLTLGAAPLDAEPVLIAETPGHTRYFIEESSVAQVAVQDGTVLQALVISRSPPDPQLRAGQVAAEAIMQFRCGEQSWREWSTIAIDKDGSRRQIIAPRAERTFNMTRKGSFEQMLVVAACDMRISGQ